MTLTPPPDDFRGIHLPVAGEMQVNLRCDVGTGESSGEVTGVRIDMWPTWLAIARLEDQLASTARANNPGPDDSEEFAAALRSELSHSVSSICSTAFTFEAFANCVKHLMLTLGSAPGLVDV